MWLILLGMGMSLLGWVMSTAKTQRWDEIPHIAALTSGGILLLWGFAIAPPSAQVGMETLAILFAFGLCHLSTRLL